MQELKTWKNKANEEKHFRENNYKNLETQLGEMNKRIINISEDK